MNEETCENECEEAAVGGTLEDEEEEEEEDYDA
jgi:hypothetical protein